MKPLAASVVRAILDAPDTELLTAAEIVQRHFGKEKAGTTEYRRTRDGVYSFGNRKGLVDFPDNGLKNEKGEYIKGRLKNKPALMEGYKSARWYGWRWKRHLEEYQSLIPDLSKSNTERKIKDDKNKKRTKRRKVTFVASTLFLAVGTLALSSLNLNDKAWLIFEEFGAQEAISFIVDTKRKSEDTFFNLGWYHYKNGNYVESQSIAREIIDSRSASKRTQAKSFFLLGAIDIDLENYESAVYHHRQSHSLYKFLNDSAGLARVELEKARPESKRVTSL